jgi:uncharacterized iron-regulated membrane protein
VSTSANSKSDPQLSSWREWLEHPEKTKIHKSVFQLHLWVGVLVAAFVFVMSVSGSLLVFRDQLEANPRSWRVPAVEWVVKVHEILIAGPIGGAVVGLGGLCLALLGITGAILWWPGLEHWRRSLTVHWKAGWARLNWDLHNTLGFCCLLFVLIWGVSGVYFVYPDPFNAAVDFLEPPSGGTKLRAGDLILQWLSNLHFGRFNWFTESIWTLLGLVPAVLSFTGMFMYCHRIFVRKGKPLER